MMQHGSAAILKTLNTLYKDLITPTVESHGGRVVKLMGDGALIDFPSAGQALEAAITIQTHLRDPEHPYTEPDRIQLRAGIHVGDVTDDGTDIFGDGVNIASRLQAAAEPGGILTSRMVRDLAGSQFASGMHGEGLRSLKGMDQPIEVLSINFTDQTAAQARTDFAKRQEIKFCQGKGGISLAWSSLGDGPPVVKAPNWVGHLELDWRNPALAPICTSVARQNRLIRFDARLNGLSDWDADSCTFEDFVDDLEAVFDAAGVHRAPILAISQGSAVAAAFAARRPERVSAIAMIGGFAVGRARRTSPKDVERAVALRQMMTAGWDDESPSLRDLMAQLIVPGASLEARSRYAEDMRAMISPQNMGRYRDVIDGIDITEILANVEAPCLVCHGTGDRMQPADQGRLLAKKLPNARFIGYDTNNHVLPDNDPEWPRFERDALRFLADHS